MGTTNKPNRRAIFVVKFIVLPYDDIDDYVCVPYSWVLFSNSRDAIDPKVLVAYPENEDPLLTRERVKKRKRFDVEWKFYMAFIKYESNTYRDAELWIARRNNYVPCEDEEPKTKDSQQEPVNKKLRSAVKPSLSSSTDKPQLTVKLYDNPRKPFPRISIRRPLQKPKENLNTMRLNVETAKPSFDYMTLGCSKREQSVIIKDVQVIQSAQAKTASNGGSNTEQRTQPESKDNPSVDMSVRFTTVSKSALPKPPGNEQASFSGQDCEQMLSMSRPVDGVHDDEGLPDCTTGSLTCQAPPNAPKQPEPESVHERLTSVVREENSLHEQRPQNVSAGQSKESIDSLKTIHQILTAPMKVQRPPSPANQFSQLQNLLLSLPVSNSYSNPQLHRGNSAEIFQNHQRSRFQGGMGSAQESHHVPNSIKTSTHLPEAVARKRSSLVIKNPVEKKPRIDYIARNVSTSVQSSNAMQPGLPNGLVIRQAPLSAQNHLQEAPKPVNNASVGGIGIDQIQLRQDVVNTSAAQRPSNIANQSCFFFEQPRQYLPTQEHMRQYLPNLQHVARVQDIFRRPRGQSIDQRAYFQTMMNGGFVVQNHQNPLNQHSQFLSQREKQYYMHQVLRHELLREPLYEAPTAQRPNPQKVEANANLLLAQRLSNVTNQFCCNSEHPQQRQNQPNYKDPQPDNSQNSGLQRVTDRTLLVAQPQISNSSKPLSNTKRSYLLQDPRIKRRLNSAPVEHHVALEAENMMAPAPTSQDSEVQTASSSDRSHEMQPTLVSGNNVYQHPRTKKMVADQATETDVTDEDETAELVAVECFPKLVDSACQTDEYIMENQELQYQEAASDSKGVAHEILLDHDVSDDEMSTHGEADVEGIAPQSNKEERPIVQNFTPENQQTGRLVAEQQMLDAFGAVLHHMDANLSTTRDLFNQLRNSALVCAEAYQTLLGKFEKFNSMEDLQIPTSPPKNVMSQIPQVTEERPAESERKNSCSGDKNNNTGVNDAPKISCKQRYTFDLPSEYDPNDSRWTLKYRKKQSGLVELMPSSGVYVGKKELTDCILDATDCKTLSRMLLTEVFSKNALSVCSLTGGKPKAFNSVNIDVRPGLDAHARMVLLAFVEEHGNKRCWKTCDSQAIISTIRTKIQEMRAKHGRVRRVKC